MSFTAGTLMKHVTKAGHLTDEQEALCRRALDQRNRVTHGFFYKHAENFLTTSGMQQIVDEADEARVMFNDAYELLMERTYTVSKGDWVSAEQVAAYMEQRIRELREQSGDQR